MQVDTAGLVRMIDLSDHSLLTCQIRQTEELQAFIHTLQELWLFGQLKTINRESNDTRNDNNAKEIQQLLSQLTDRWTTDDSKDKDAMETGE